MQIIALDLETTGLDNKKDKIIEVALVKFDTENFEIIEKFESLINPLIPIPPLNSNITNIFDEDVKDSPVFDHAMINKIQEFIGSCPILGHNTYFDRDFLINNGVSIENNIVLDTFTLSNIFLFEEKSLNLGSLCQSLGIELLGAHRAINDVIATIGLFKGLKNIFSGFSTQKQELISYIFKKSTHESFSTYLEIFSQNIEKIGEDYFIKTLKKIIGKIEIKETKIHEDQTINIKLEEVFSKFNNFEIRQNQLIMSKNIEDSLKNNKKFLIEAPTGVGKTFAYLIPSILYSLKNKEQVFISTNTKTLQDQIYYKDLQFLKSNLGHEFNYTKLKGKKNYFSISRFVDLFFSTDKFDINQTAFFSKIVLWLYKTDFGELDELTYYPKEFSFLKYINADHFTVLKEENEYKFYEYLFKARFTSQNSNVVIINHSILLQDIKNKGALFPEIKKLIVDEAHNLEDTTTDALKKSFTQETLGETFGIIKNILNKHNKIIDNLDNKFSNILSQISLLFDLLSDYSIKKANSKSANFDTLIEKDFFNKDLNIVNLKNNIEISFIGLLNIFGVLEDKIYNSLKTEITILEEVLETIRVAMDENAGEHYIPVFSYNEAYSNSISFMLLNPGKFLQNNLWEKIDSIVLTSATLKIGNDFSYISNILSLKEEFNFLSLESDFDYSKQALLFVPNDLGSVKYTNNFLNNFILDFLRIVGGNTLVLLTSFSSIKELYLFTNIELKKLGTTILSQSISGSKHKIISDFKSNPSKKVILGTDSFWEGVDFPGEDLKYLIIYKFPFGVPTDPIFKARSKLFKDPFKEYSIPKAIIKTKQGFGRLIRTKSDKGIVIFLDDRFLNTNWGYLMKNSFPENINSKFGNSKDFLEMVKEKVSKTS